MQLIRTTFHRYSTKTVAPTATAASVSISSKPDNNFKVKRGPGGRSSLSGHTVTVFGCSGFLGRYLVNELGIFISFVKYMDLFEAKAGSQVIVPYRGPSEYIRDLKVTGDLGQVVQLKFSLDNPESIEQCIRHSDTVYNLIGRDYETRNYSFYDVHVEGARRIANICKQTPGVNRFIHVSALNADVKSQSQFLKTKGQGEIAVEIENPEAILVRPGAMYGWEDRLLRYLGHTVTHPIKRWATGGFIPLIDGGEHILTPTYVNDVARGLHALMEAENPKHIYEFYGPKPFSYREFVELFCEYTRKPFSPISVPYKLFRSIVSYSQHNPLARITVHDVDRWVVDDMYHVGAGTLEDVGVTPRELEDLLITFVRQYRGNEAVEQPGDVREVKYWKRFNEENSA